MLSRNYLAGVALILAVTCAAGMLHTSVVFPVVSASLLLMLSTISRQENGFDDVYVAPAIVVAASVLNAAAASAAAFGLGQVSIWMLVG